jgi:hypothetical protein
MNVALLRVNVALLCVNVALLRPDAFARRCGKISSPFVLSHDNCDAIE